MAICHLAVCSGLIPLGAMCPLDKQIHHKISQNFYPNKLIFTFLNITDDFMSFRHSFHATQVSYFPTVKYGYHIVRVKYSKIIFFI